MTHESWKEGRLFTVVPRISGLLQLSGLNTAAATPKPLKGYLLNPDYGSFKPRDVNEIFLEWVINVGFVKFRRIGS